MKSILKKLVLPISQNEDAARQEFILNVLLLGVICLSFVALVANFLGWILDLHKAESTQLIFSSFYFFVFLYLLSRKGYVRISSLLLLAALFLPVTHQVYKWGVDLPISLLVYAVIIIMAGVLISTRTAFVVSIIISFAMIIIGYFQTTGAILVDRYWVSEIVSLADLIMVSLLFIIIATVSWLSNREIEKSLSRARRSEADLKEERDSLEITVEARTRELKETQAEKIAQLYRFAEFGRLSSGLFHDLINPLTAVSLNIEKVKNAGETKQYVDMAVVAARKMEGMVNAVRKQLSRRENKTLFSVHEEIAQALEVLSYKAQKAGVAMRLSSREDLRTYGDAVKFNQVALNLIANAIDAYVPVRSFDVSVGAKEGKEKAGADSRTVTMSLSQNGDVIIFKVKDKGVGISEENKPKLFEPFFTTKAEGHGIGIGLSMTKRIIENDFGGNISVESKEGEGSVFTVKFTKRNNEQEYPSR